MTDLQAELASMNEFVGDYADNAQWETWKRVEAQAREAERMRGWEARYMELYQRLSVMADRWDQAVFEHSLEPMAGEDFHQTENRRVLFECRPLADFEEALAPATGCGE